VSDQAPPAALKPTLHPPDEPPVDVLPLVDSDELSDDVEAAVDVDVEVAVDVDVSAPPSGTVNVQFGNTHLAPRPAHLQSVSVVHHPLSPLVAATHVCGVTAQLQTSVPQAVPPSAQSMSLVQARAAVAHDDAAAAERTIANAKTVDFMGGSPCPVHACRRRRSIPPRSHAGGLERRGAVPYVTDFRATPPSRIVGDHANHASSCRPTPLRRGRAPRCFLRVSRVRVQ
jgi:hypothetical protein